MRSILSRPVKWLLLALVLVLAVSGVTMNAIWRVPSYGRTVYAMDTLIQLTAYGRGAEDALAQAETRLHEIESKFSAYRPDSQIARLNRGETDQVDDEVFGVLSRALAVCEATGGRFDITVGPLTALWNIMGESPHVPTQAEIDEALTRVGYQDVQLDAAQNRVIFQKKGMALDLGGVIKGYAAEEVLRILKEAGVQHACIDLGGNVAVMGGMPLSPTERLLHLFSGETARPFVVGIQDPSAPRGTPAQTIQLSDGMVVTAGDYERYFEQDGVRYHHILDPRTGYPVNRGVHSVTVVTEDGLLADCLSTAIFVDGAVAERFPDVQVITLP